MPPYGYGYYMDPYYGLVLIGLVICLLAQLKVKMTFSKYSRVRSNSGFTGSAIAGEILKDNDLSQVMVTHVGGSLTDHFDPRNMTVNLSQDVYDSNSIAAIAVASHECGHVLQHKNNYFPYSLRHLLVPAVNFGSSISWILIFFGIMLGYSSNNAYFGSGIINVGGIMLNAGILCFSLAVLFQVVTLPVEFNASRRAIRILKASNRFSHDELRAAKKVLSAAALTYVAGTAASLLQLLRLILLFGRRRD